MSIKFRFLLIFVIVLLSNAFFTSCSVFNKSVKSYKFSSDEKDYLNYKFAFYEGQKQMMLGNLALATQYFLQCTKTLPDRATPYFQLAQLTYMQKDYHNAVMYCELAHNKEPENLWMSKFLINLYEGFNQYDKAYDLLQDVLKLKPNDYLYIMESARILSILGKTQDALKIYNRMEQIFGINESTSLAKEKLYVTQKEYEKAEQEVDNLIRFYPSNYEYLDIKGDLLIIQKKYDEAITYYEDIIQKNPDFSILRVSLAEIYQLKHESKKAIDELKIAFASNDIDIKQKGLIIYSYMRYYESDNEIFPEIEDLILTVIKANPKESESHTIYSDYLVQAKRYKDAREQLLMIKDNAKGNYLVWEQLIFLDANLEDNKLMFEHSKEAIDLFPNQSKFYLYAGTAAFMQHQYRDAINILNSGIDLVAVDSSAIYDYYTYLGESFYRLKKLDSAFYYLDMVVDADTGNYVIMNNYCYYLSLADTNLIKAEKLMKKVIKRYPENFTYHDTYAWVLYKQKRYKLALTIINFAVEKGGYASAVILEHQGDILYKLGKMSEAIQTWQKAQKVGKGSDFLSQKIKEGKLIE